MPIDGATPTCPSEKDLHVEQSENVKFGLNSMVQYTCLMAQKRAMEVSPSNHCMHAANLD